MESRRQFSVWQVVAAVAVLFCLLLAISVHPHSLNGVMGCPVLAVVFLFAIVVPIVEVWRLSEVIQESSPQHLAIPVRSQRPPPSSL
jgi:hypothetical protein